MDTQKQLKFPKTARLRSKSEYQAVFSFSCKVVSHILIVFAKPNTHDSARLGLAISRRCSKLAVERNRIKRVLRQAFRLIRYQLPKLDLVVVCKPVASQVTNSVLSDAFLTQITKVCRRSCAELS
ncbi:hypothetical protein TI04_08950 [Achromatium sp. WMS2]|nr:hypothetical protein TI04_08950 [Achromatium sp. WMS2]